MIMNVLIISIKQELEILLTVSKKMHKIRKKTFFVLLKKWNLLKRWNSFKAIVTQYFQTN